MVSSRITIKKLESLTGVRFFAALSVVLFHYSIIVSVTRVLPRLAAYGQGAVCLFFVLSGFILVYNYLSVFENQLNLNSYWRFMRARFARVYPMHCFALLVATCVFIVIRNSPLLLSWEPKTTSPAVAASSWVINLFLLEIYIPIPSFEQLYNAPAWSIGCEIFFYALTPGIISLYLARLRTPQAAILAAISVWFIQCALFAAVIYLLRSCAAKESTIDFVAYRMPFFRIWEFVIGGCMAMVVHRSSGIGIRSSAFRNLLLATGIAGVLAVPYCCPHLPLNPYSQWYVAVTPLYALIVLCLGSGKTFLGALLENKFLVVLGEASYSLYLLHTIPETILHAIYGRQTPVLLAAAVVISTILISIACLRFIEMPARNLLKGKPKSEQPQPRSAHKNVAVTSFTA